MYISMDISMDLSMDIHIHGNPAYLRNASRSTYIARASHGHLCDSTAFLFTVIARNVWRIKVNLELPQALSPPLYSVTTVYLAKHNTAMYMAFRLWVNERYASDRQTDKYRKITRFRWWSLYSRRHVEWAEGHFGLSFIKIDPISWKIWAKNDFYVFVLSDLDL